MIIKHKENWEKRHDGEEVVVTFSFRNFDQKLPALAEQITTREELAASLLVEIGENNFVASKIFSDLSCGWDFHPATVKEVVLGRNRAGLLVVYEKRKNA